MTFMDESFGSLHKFSDAFNVWPFVLVVVGMVITHHLLFTSLWVNVSHLPLKIFLWPLTSDAMVVLGQMAPLSYVAQQSVTVREGQAQSKPIPMTGMGEMDPTLKSDHGLNAGLIPQKLKLDQAGLTQSKKDQLEAQSSKTPTLPVFPQDPPREDTPPPPPLPYLAKKHNTPRNQNAHPGGSVASLLAQFQQSQHSQLQDASPKNMPSKNTPVKDTPKKGEQMLTKKLLMPDKSAELPIKSNGPAPPAVIEEVKLTTTGWKRAKRRRKGRRKNLRVSPPWPPTQKQRRLKNDRRNARGQGSGRWS